MLAEVNKNFILEELPKPSICPNTAMCYALMHICPEFHYAFSKLFLSFGTLPKS